MHRYETYHQTLRNTGQTGYSPDIPRVCELCNISSPSRPTRSHPSTQFKSAFITQPASMPIRLCGCHCSKTTTAVYAVAELRGCGCRCERCDSKNAITAATRSRIVLWSWKRTDIWWSRENEAGRTRRGDWGGGVYAIARLEKYIGRNKEREN